jgi:hypothetical protein
MPWKNVLESLKVTTLANGSRVLHHAKYPETKLGFYTSLGSNQFLLQQFCTDMYRGQDGVPGGCSIEVNSGMMYEIFVHTDEQ